MGIYAGIGARQAPTWATQLAFNVGQAMGQQGHILRSGKANGMDTAFEAGCDSVRGLKEIYIPWDRFNRARISQGYIPINQNMWLQLNELVRKYHPNPRALSTGARLLMMRNCHQVLGYRLDSPADFVLFWAAHVTRYNGTISDCAGGTGFAVRLAYAYGVECIPVEEYGK